MYVTTKIGKAKNCNLASGPFYKSCQEICYCCIVAGVLRSSETPVLGMNLLVVKLGKMRQGGYPRRGGNISTKLATFMY